MEIQEIADDLLARRSDGRFLNSDVAQPRVADQEAAWSVQDAIVAANGKVGVNPIGYKIGATSQAARDMLGIPGPFRGVLFDRTSHLSGAQLPRGNGVFQVWEVEIAVRLGRDLDPSEAPFSASEIESATAALIPAIEIVGSAWQPFNKAPQFDLIADNAVHGAWIHGGDVDDWSAMDLTDGPISLAFDGQIVAEGRGANVEGGPFGSTAWLANELAQSGRALRAGDVVTTGTVTPLVPIDGAGVAVADFGPLGRVEVTLT